MKIESNEVINILSNSTIIGNKLYLPDIVLERSLYVKVDKVLKSLGGKWNTKTKAHIFEKDPSEAIEQIILTSEYVDIQKDFQFFETPDNIAQRLVKLANIKDGETVLEPSAGRGAIAKFIKNCDCVELNDKNRKVLIEKGFNVVGDNFLSFNKKYDVIIANPPFCKQQDIDHVLHMIELANRCVVSIMSSSITFRSNKKTTNFKKVLNKFHGSIIPLPEKSFSKSGTNVNTCIVVINKNL